MKTTRQVISEAKAKDLYLLMKINKILIAHNLGIKNYWEKPEQNKKNLIKAEAIAQPEVVYTSYDKNVIKYMLEKMDTNHEYFIMKAVRIKNT